MKPDGTNFKHMRVCERCGNTFESDKDILLCKSCDDFLTNKVKYLIQNHKFGEADELVREITDKLVK